VDAYLAAEALQAFGALSAVSPGKGVFGFLLGHKRGRRYFVEKIFPAPSGFQPTLQNLVRLDRLFADKIIGFFASGSRRRDVEEQLKQPYAAGRLYLDVRFRKDPRSPGFKSYAIDFDGRFRFEPLALTVER
jgi:hypothetical protein